MIKSLFLYPEPKQNLKNKRKQKKAKDYKSDIYKKHIFFYFLINAFFFTISTPLVHLDRKIFLIFVPE